MPLLTIILFSKNRGCQLELLLRSMKKYFKNLDKFDTIILYTFDKPEYGQGYDITKKLHPEFKYVQEKNFKQDLLSCINPENKYTMFGVDDNLFLEKFDMECPEVKEFERRNNMIAVSLRMQSGMNYCYPQNIHTEPPTFEQSFEWRWPGLVGDWGYPLSEDFHLFKTVDIIDFHRNIEYNNPNELEGRMSNYLHTILAKPYMSCFVKAKVVNIPANKVQTVNSNRHGSISAEYMNNKFLAGKQIQIFNTIPNHFAPHVEYDYTFEDRTAI